MLQCGAVQWGPIKHNGVRLSLLACIGLSLSRLLPSQRGNARRVFSLGSPVLSAMPCALTDLYQCAVRDDGTVLFKFGSEAEAAAASDSASEEAQDEPAPQAATPPEAAVKSVKKEEAAQSAEQAPEAPAVPGLHGFQITKPQLCASTC